MVSREKKKVDWLSVNDLLQQLHLPSIGAPEVLTALANH